MKGLKDVKAKDIITILAKKKRIVVCAAACLALIVAAFGIPAISESESVIYEQVQAQKVKMEQTITAAGEVVAGSSEEIAFDTSSAYCGMCVEAGDSVRKGQHLISYSDGTYTDAPDNGVVTAINAPEAGDTADSDNMVSIDYTDTLILEISVPESEISKVSKGDAAKITVNADTSKTFNGTITSVKAITSDLLSSSTQTESDSSSETGSIESSENSADAETPQKSSQQTGMQTGAGSSAAGITSNYSVSVKLINDGSLRLGMSANCTITVASRSNVLAVPVEAVLFDEDGKAYVNVCDGNELTKTFVTTGESDAQYVEITEGLSEDDTVQVEVHG